jgi:hypothetical protein
MCSACVMTAAASATGVRAWLKIHAPFLATPARMRAVTIALFVAATLASTVGLSGSSATTSAHAALPAAHAAVAQR